jgi:hypothetical protein
MYKNFKITEEERQQILESHMSHGYKKPLNEQSDDDSTQDTEEENYSEHPLWNDLTNTYDGPIGVRTVIYRIIELSKEGKYSEDDILDIGIKAIELMQKESHNGVYYGGGSEPMGY